MPRRAARGKQQSSRSTEPDVRALRADLDLTQQEMADHLGVKSITIHRWESGKSRPSPLALKRIRGLEEQRVGRYRVRRVKTLRAAARPHLDLAGDPEAVLAVVDAWRLRYGHQFNPTFARETSRIDPLPHQRIAVYERMLGQRPLRFLLADDAGAGKTIMTGLYVREMLLRGRLKRILIVPPAGLVGNWQSELRDLFDLSFRIVTGQNAVAGEGQFRRGNGDLVIVSLDTVAGKRVFEALSAPDVAPYDLVVFDEAHKLSATAAGGRTRKTRRYKLAEALSGCPDVEKDYAALTWSAPNLLLLTATPHMGKTSPYYHLWRLLDPQAFSTEEAFRRLPATARRKHFIRRTKEEMVSLSGEPLFRPRHCDTFTYDLSVDEQALYDRTTRYLREMYGRALDNQPAIQLALSVFQRRLASSTWALLRSFGRRIDRLQQLMIDLRSGAVTAVDLERRQRSLGQQYDNDYFDRTSADDDAPGDGSREANEEYEAAVLGAVHAVTLEELEKEVATVRALRERARRLWESGRESKFEQLRAVLEGQAEAAEKWIVFSEHRDTVDYLVQRLEGLGYTGKVAQIHGGMAWQEREVQVEHFRNPHGARFLIATDAAGEGINLQHCRFMANYDIPWNPARLEQRMGRIHRYGQKHDVRIVNLVAAGTYEGRVLQVLLKKLEAIRGELSSDKVYDVVGRLLENCSLREHMLEALVGESATRGADRIEEALTVNRVRSIRAEEQRTYGLPGDVAGRLKGLRADQEREEYLRLLPAHVRLFVERSARLLNLEVRGDLDGSFTLAPRRDGALDPLLAAFEESARRQADRPAGPADGRASEPLRFCLRPASRPGTGEGGPAPVWLRPGEPVFDSLSELVCKRFAVDAQRGAIFIDHRSSDPYYLYLVETRIQEGTASPGQQVELSTPSRLEPGVDGDRHLVAIRHGAGSEGPAECPVESLLGLSAPRVPTAPGSIPLASRAISMSADALHYVQEHVLRPRIEERRRLLKAELHERRQRLNLAFDLRSSALLAERAKARRSGDLDEVQRIKARQLDLSATRARELQQLERSPEQVRPGGARIVAHALVIPPARPEEYAPAAPHIEQFAMQIASDWERDHGATVSDVSRPEYALQQGLPPHPGFDLLSVRPSGEKRHIEVKGRSGRNDVQLERNEWTQANHLGESYWLYVVFDCETSRPRLCRVQDPFAELLASQNVRFRISASQIFGAARPDSQITTTRRA